VENDRNNITDLVCFGLLDMLPVYGITTVVSTQSRVKQLIMDALVCAKKIGMKDLRILQCGDAKPDILSSLSFEYQGDLCNFLIYNYQYHESKFLTLSSGLKYDHAVIDIILWLSM